MGKKTKKGKGRLDKYYHLAKEQGYRSRAAFKLIQLNRKYQFLESSRSLLDLCAAPGGWLQVAAKTMPASSLILGIDLVPIRPIRGVVTLQGDITTQKARQDIKREAKGALFDTVVHDGAPNVGGAWTSEAYSQAALVLDSLKLATEHLKPGGTFVTKVFRSREYTALLYALNQLFERVEATKPPSSRNTSAEIFVVGLKYKAPAKIDPRLLDHKVLFQEVEEAPRNMGPDALLKMKAKQRRFREGYEDGISTTHKAMSAATFILSESPVELLGKHTQILLDGPQSETVAEPASDGDTQKTSLGRPEEAARVAELARTSDATTTEVRSLCGDLQVLGRSELKQLLRWRLALRRHVDKWRKDADKVEADGLKEGEAADVTPEGMDAGEAALLKEMAEVKRRMEERQKRDRKRRRETKKKAKIRAAQARMVGGGDRDMELFDLKEIKSRKNVQAVTEAPMPESGEVEESESEKEDMSDYGGSDSSEEMASEEEDQLRYEALMEEYLERGYREQAVKQGTLYKGEGDRVALPKHRLDDDGELGQDGMGDAEAVALKAAEVAKRLKRPRREEEEDGGLVVTFDERKAGIPSTKAAMAQQWFSDKLFQDVLADGSDQEDGDDEAVPAGRPDKIKDGVELSSDDEEGAANGAGGASVAEDSDEEEARDILRMKEQHLAGGSGRDKAGEKGSAVMSLAAKRDAKRAGFEVVRAESPRRSKGGAGDSGSDSSRDSSDSEDEFEALPDNAKAEVLALARKMIRAKGRQSILDAAYNRYAFHDDNLPEWFEEDEEKHMRPLPPVTPEEIEAEKARLRAIDARPIKKVAEAKARKKKRAVAAMAKAQAKAQQVADQEDVPMGSRMREIARIYAKAKRTGKGGKGGKGRDNKRKGPPLDKRLKKDLRGQKKAGRGRGGKARGGIRKGGR